MGAAKSRPVREAPVRYVAKQLPRVDRTPVEQQFKKPEFTAQGINRRLDDVNTEPLMYVETSKDASSTELTDHTAPRWYLNTYMEMVDNQRTDQVIISGNLPLSWERDKFEPYALVRGRIDDEDLRWVLAAEQRKKGVDALLPSTKLERDVLQDILDTVELPRMQYRNYKGKLHKTIEDANTHIAARKEQLERAREEEILRKIGYSEEEVLQEEQYLNNRTRGVKSLDALGASLREKKRRERAAQANEMEDLLEERRTQELEAGVAAFTEEELLEKPEVLGIKPKPYGTRRQVYKHVYAADFGKDDRNQAKFQWWLDRTRRIKRAVDTIHGVPVYNERLSANEEQTRKQMREAAEFNFTLSQAQGAKGFTDPRGHYDEFMSVLRQNKDLNDDSRVEVHEDDILKNDVFRFPHTKGHGPKSPPKRFTDKGEKPEKVCTDVNRLHRDEEAAQAVQQGVRAAEEVVRQHARSKQAAGKSDKESLGDVASYENDPSSKKEP
ncbi:putative dynein heavy chain [Trypanosoma conorhini]|uniref:Putative dynein heavy chain n=1 Tax=Trypanosoma conorhini TaxID=83891 RepID=A0A422N9D7_9TRYP|nr:putative dynein heavy chain [Trypanosoma conorhini]RNF02061.1 putative dynein heavy chain [Trypanosoma conorhini]